MADPVGLSGQLTFTKETTYGTHVAPATTIPMVPGETLDREITRIRSKGIIAGRKVHTARQWSPGGWVVGGDTPLELLDRGIDTLWELMLGGVSTDTYTPGDLPSATVQKGVPDGGGTVRPWTMIGAMVGSWEIAWKPDEYATLGLTWVAQRAYGHRSVADGATNSNTTVTSATAGFNARDLGSPISGGTIPAGATITAVNSATSVTISAAAGSTATGVTLTIGVALATATYSTTQRPFTAEDATLTLGGSTLKIVEGKLGGDNKLEGRPHAGQRWVEKPQPTGLREYKFEPTVEFLDRTQLDRYEKGDEFAAVITFAAYPASGTGASIVATLNGYYDGTAGAMVESEGVIQQKLSMTLDATAAGADSSAISVVVTEGA